jgi:type IV fimbrial biogenesis protein FimT
MMDARHLTFPARANRARGFTLIELMVTLTVLGVMLGIGIPAFKDFIDGQRVKSAAFELMSSLLIARSEAVTRHTTVTITPLSGGAWVSGWSVTAGGTLLHKQQAIEGITVATQNSGCTASATVASVAFASTGRPSASSCFKFSGNTSAMKCVKVDSSGSPSTITCP